MSMNADIKKDIVAFCMKKKLLVQDAVELNLSIMESLDWDDSYNEEYEDSEATMVSQIWDELAEFERVGGSE